MGPAVDVQDVSKRYSKNANEHLSYGVSDLFTELFGRKRNVTLRKDEFFAVDKVSLQLNPGDTLGMIGRNGSGKTTLLKMMNGLVKPDAGRIVMEGRVQALINLGAGFNPALSGMDNIYNSASLMGLTSKEIEGIVDEVVEFAELEEFIHSPVGTYSSGMHARLGFAVAVHLKPDILLVDEVLAVGDFAFQNKCYTRMEALKKSGVTIVFVSHSHPKVIQLCERAIWLHRGKVMEMGPALETVQAYLSFLESEEQKKLEESIKKQKAAQAPKPKPKPQTKARPKPKTAPPPTPQDQADDPNLIVAVSEPKVAEPEIFLDATQDHFLLRGWYTASAEKTVVVSLNDEPLDVELVARPDVEMLHPDAPVAKGFRIVIDREMLEETNQAELQLDGTVHWSRAIIVEGRQEGSKPTPGSGKGLYGPVYHTEGRVQDIACALHVDGQDLSVVPIHSDLVLRYAFRLTRDVDNLHMTISFFSKDGFHVAAIASLQKGIHKDIQNGWVRGEVHIPDFDLTPGTYVIVMPICQGKSYLFRDVVKEFAVSGGGELFWGVKEFKCEHEVRNE